MKRKLTSLTAVLLALALVFALSACGGEPAATPAPGQPSAAPSGEPQPDTPPAPADDGETYTLRLGSFPGDTMTWMEQFAEEVSEASNGRLQLEVMNFLTLGSPIDAVNMTKDGSLDMIVSSGTNYVGYEPCSAVIAVPNVVDNVMDAFALESAMLEEGYFSDWDGEVISIMLTDMQYIAMAKKEVKSAADFSGLIGRCQNANGVAVLQKLGSSITTINTNEVYMSLETGVIDFSVSSPTNMLTSAYTEVVDYIIDRPLYCDVNCLIMNNDAFASLPADLQQVLKDCGAKLTEDYQAWLADAEASAIQQMKDAGVSFIPCPEDVDAVIAEAAAPCMDSYMETLGQAGVDTAAFQSFIEEHLG